MLQGIANPPWQVGVGRRNHKAFGPALDAHNSGQRVLSYLSGFRVLDNPSHLFLQTLIEMASDRHQTLGIPVVSAMTSWTCGGCRAYRHKPPRPSPFVKHRAASAAYRCFLELPSQLVGVMLVFLNRPVPTRSMTSRAFHFARHCFTFPFRTSMIEMCIAEIRSIMRLMSLEQRMWCDAKLQDRN